MREDQLIDIINNWVPNARADVQVYCKRFGRPIRETLRSELRIVMQWREPDAGQSNTVHIPVKTSCALPLGWQRVDLPDDLDWLLRIAEVQNSCVR